ncbi:resolvase [Halorubrum sp. 48-1-W]|nr:resolvase [Halorubrum sp. 48-1-W]
MLTACYVRVSTEEQNLERQLQSVQSYAEEKLNTELSELQIFRDKSTGTDTSRSGYRDMMETLEGEDIEHVVVHEISRLARSLQDLERTVSRITDNGTAIHFVRDGLSFGDGKEQPMNRLQMQMLGAFAEWQARVKQMNTKEGIAARQDEDDYHHGRPPLGFEKNDGQLIEGENYGQVCAVLDMVVKGDLSKRKAAQELDSSRKTIDRAIDRGSLYGI